MTIPYHLSKSYLFFMLTYDMAFHGNSMSFHVTNKWQFGPNWYQIPWLFHVIYPGLICFPCWNMTWILDKSKPWNFRGICWENDGIFIGFGLIFDQFPVKKAWKIRVTFLQGFFLLGKGHTLYDESRSWSRGKKGYFSHSSHSRGGNKWKTDTGNCFSSSISL